MRASEQRKKPGERIVDDSYARLFLGPMLRVTLATWDVSGRLGNLAEQFSPGLLAFVLCRHRYIDDRLLHALAGEVEQVVLLGAGDDTRSPKRTSSLAVTCGTVAACTAPHTSSTPRSRAAAR